MKIKKMTAHFGELDGESLELSEGMNILYAPNENRKSTWCAFIQVMLYGISTSERAKDDRQPDELQYNPWSGKPMSGSMDVERPGGQVTICRWTEQAGAPMQAFSASVTGTDTRVGLSEKTAGEMLTGVPQTVFERSAFIRQSGLAVSDNPELEKRVNTVVSSGEEEVSFAETKKCLQEWLHSREDHAGEISGLDVTMKKTDWAMEDIQEDTRELAALDEEMEQLLARQSRAEDRMAQARAEQRKTALAEMSAARENLHQAEEARQEAAAAVEAADDELDGTVYGRMGPEEAARRSETDEKNAVELLRMAGRLPPVKIAYIPLIIAAAAFLLAVFLPWTVECVGVGCIMMLLFVTMYLRLVSIRKTKEDTLDDRNRILQAYGVSDPGEIHGLLEEYRILWKEKERAEFRLEEAEEALFQARSAQKETESQAVAGLDFQNGSSPAAQASREVEQIKARLTAVKERRAALENQAQVLGDPMEMASDVAVQADALHLANKALDQADTELQEQFSPALAAKAEEYLAQLTGSRYADLSPAQDFSTKACLQGDAVDQEADYLSAVAQDQLYLSLRLAVCALALPAEDPCPIILDDALANFDDARMAQALELLKGLARERQILLFTCHRREMNHFADDPAVACLSLAADA